MIVLSTVKYIKLTHVFLMFILTVFYVILALSFIEC